MQIRFFINIKECYYYAGSLIIDFKYRKKTSFWGNGNNNSQEQLRQYRNNITSIYYLNFPESRSKDKRVAQEVWVLYPDKYNTDNVDYEVDDKIKFLSFIPRHESSIEERLNNFINNIRITANYEFIYEVKGVKPYKKTALRCGRAAKKQCRAVCSGAVFLCCADG